MEDMLPEIEALGDLLRQHKGGDVLVLDLRKMNTWTDFFVIATATSNTHLDGLERHIKDFCGERGIEILRRSRRPDAPARTRVSYGTSPSFGTSGQDDEWRIIDLGSAVIHLMSGNARAFYELERLYA